MNSSRRPFIAGNWKMNTTVEEGVALARAVAGGTLPNDTDVVICPPFTHLDVIHAEIAGSNLELGAQDVFYEENGAYTGEISAAMLKELCDWVIVGHSERRRLGDTDLVVDKKFKAAQDEGLGVILCVGESRAEREIGHAWEIVRDQLAATEAAFSDPAKVVIAYEPVWAIGTGLASSPQDAQMMISSIREWIGETFGNEIADEVRIIYGGSVNAANAQSFFSEPDIDGALPGGASLKAEEFLGIVAQVMAATKR